MAKYKVGDQFAFTALYYPEFKYEHIIINPARWTCLRDWERRNQRLDMISHNWSHLETHGVEFPFAHENLRKCIFRIDAIYHGRNGYGEFDDYICNALLPKGYTGEIRPIDGFMFCEEVLDAAEKLEAAT